MKKYNLQLLVEVLIGQTFCTSEFWILLHLGSSSEVFIPRSTMAVSHSYVIAISSMAGISRPNPLSGYHGKFEVPAACAQFCSNGFPPLRIKLRLFLSISTRILLELIPSYLKGLAILVLYHLTLPFQRLSPQIRLYLYLRFNHPLPISFLSLRLNLLLRW